MTSLIVSNTALSTQTTVNPAVAYLASRQSENTRRNMRKCLNMATDVLSNNAFVAPVRPLKQDFDNETDYKQAVSQYKLDRADYEQRYLSIRWQDLRNDHIAHVQAQLLEAYKFTTVNLVLSALRGVVRQTWKLGIIDADQRDRVSDIDNIKGQTIPAGRDVKNIEFLRLLEDCKTDDNEVIGIRDFAILLLMRNLGLRRSEVVNLKVSDLDRTDGKLRITGAKGNTDNEDFISKQTLEAVNRWLDLRQEEALTSDTLFVTINKGGRITGRKLTKQTLYKMLKRRCDRQNIDEVTPHDLRRTMITRGLEAGIDVITISKRARHKSVETTKRYDRRGDQTKRNAAEALDDFSIPFFL